IFDIKLCQRYFTCLNHGHGESTMSYRQKQAAVTLVALCVLGLILFVRLEQAEPRNMGAALPILVQSGLAMIAIMIAANVAIRIHGRVRGETTGDDERDTLI